MAIFLLSLGVSWKYFQMKTDLENKEWRRSVQGGRFWRVSWKIKHNSRIPCIHHDPYTYEPVHESDSDTEDAAWDFVDKKTAIAFMREGKRHKQTSEWRLQLRPWAWATNTATEWKKQ